MIMSIYIHVTIAQSLKFPKDIYLACFSSCRVFCSSNYNLPQSFNFIFLILFMHRDRHHR